MERGAGVTLAAPAAPPERRRDHVPFLLEDEPSSSILSLWSTGTEATLAQAQQRTTHSLHAVTDRALAGFVYLMGGANKGFSL